MLLVALACCRPWSPQPIRTSETSVFSFFHLFSHRGTGGRFLGFPSRCLVPRDEGVTAVLAVRVGYEGEGEAMAQQNRPTKRKRKPENSKSVYTVFNIYNTSAGQIHFFGALVQIVFTTIFFCCFQFSFVS